MLIKGRFLLRSKWKGRKGFFIVTKVIHNLLTQIITNPKVKETINKTYTYNGLSSRIKFIHVNQGKAGMVTTGTGAVEE